MKLVPCFFLLCALSVTHGIPVTEPMNVPEFVNTANVTEFVTESVNTANVSNATVTEGRHLLISLKKIFKSPPAPKPAPKPASKPACICRNSR